MRVEFVPRYPVIQDIAYLVCLAMGSLALLANFWPNAHDTHFLVLPLGAVLATMGATGYGLVVRKITFLEEHLEIRRVFFAREVKYAAITKLTARGLTTGRDGYYLQSVKNLDEYEKILASLQSNGKVRPFSVAATPQGVGRRFIFLAMGFGVAGYLGLAAAAAVGWLDDLSRTLVDRLQFGFVAMVVAVYFMYRRK